MGFRVSLTYIFEPNGNDFTGIRNGNKYIHKRQIVAEPFRWQSGYAITFAVEEIYDMSVNDEIYLPNLTRVSFNKCYYDKDTTPEIGIILAALISQDVRGQVAQNMVWEVFRNLVLEKNEEWITKYFPEWKEHYTKMLDRFQKGEDSDGSDSKTETNS